MTSTVLNPQQTAALLRSGRKLHAALGTARDLLRAYGDVEGAREVERLMDEASAILGEETTE